MDLEKKYYICNAGAFVLVNIIVLVYLYVSFNQLVMLRVYELSERRAQFPVLRVEYRRFYRDIPLSIRYSFSTNDFTLNASASWTSTEIGECMRQFAELVQSPHWRAEIEPYINYRHYERLFDFRCDE